MAIGRSTTPLVEVRRGEPPLPVSIENPAGLTAGPLLLMVHCASVPGLGRRKGVPTGDSELALRLWCTAVARIRVTLLTVFPFLCKEELPNRSSGSADRLLRVGSALKENGGQGHRPSHREGLLDATAPLRARWSRRRALPSQVFSIVPLASRTGDLPDGLGYADLCLGESE